MRDAGPPRDTPSSDVEGELFALIVESSVDFAIFTMDILGRVTSWNVGARRLFGYEAAEMLGVSADVLFTDEDRGAGAPEWERAQATTAGRAEDERWHRRRDGSVFWASGLLMPLRERSAGFVKITRDRTERHGAERRLRESEERFRTLATSIPQLVFLTRPDGHRTWPSPQWVEFTGLGEEASRGLNWLDAIHPEDVAATLSEWKAAVAAGEYYVEHRVRRKSDGAYRWHQTRARPLQVPHTAGSDWVGTMTDIDDLRRLKDQQQVLMAELQHRTRNLLAVVQSIANQTIRKSGSVETFGVEFDARLRALGRVQGIIARANQAAIDLRTLVDAELRAHHAADPKTGAVTIEGPSVAIPTGSAQALGLALHELTTNAVKYGALAVPGGRLTVRWTVEPGAPHAHVLVEWAESGVAISTAQSAKRGYGTELIVRALPYQLGARTTLDFTPDGVRCTIAVPIDQTGGPAA